MGKRDETLRVDRAPPAPQPPSPPARGARTPGPELADVLFGDAPGGEGRTGALAFTASTEIAAAVDRRTARVQRAALAVAALAVLVALGGLAVARWSGRPAATEAAAAHLQAADRLLGEGRLSGKDGALEHLLAARRLRPEDPGARERLERAADLLERLAAGALERGDLAVASIHLASARAAAPDRASLRAKQAELDRRLHATARQ